jgi:tetratricopeptide (TPR) repeat protein
MRLSALLIAYLLAAAPALAQQPPSRPDVRPPSVEGKPSTGKPGEPNPDAPRPASLDDLFDRLGKATDEAEAKGIAGLIERRWARSGSDTADLLLSRATQAAADKDFPLSIELLDRVIALEPQWVEAWYRRANVFFLLDDPVDAMADLKQVLSREPRHYAAWAGLGHIYMSSDDKAHALEAYRKALAIYPRIERIGELVDRLKLSVDGQDL